MRTTSLRRRVTATTLGLLAVTLVVLNVFVYLSLESRLDSALRQRVGERAALAAELGPRLSPQALVERLAGDGIEATVRGRAGEVAREPPRPVRGPRAGPGGPKGGPSGKPAAGPRDPTALVPLPEGSTVLLVGRRVEIDTTLSRLLALEVFGSVAVLLLVAASVSRVVRIALRPLDRMVSTATRIARGATDERLAPSRTDTELGRLASAFDAMVDSLERALRAARDSEERMRTFLSDASHELRTPLAGVQAGAETLLREDPDRERRERLLVGMVRLASRGGRLVDDLMAAARTAESLPLRRERVDLVRLSADEVERTRRLAPACRVEQEAPGFLAVVGDPERLAQILGNLLDNARHASRPGGSILVALSEYGAAGVEIAVADEGPGIPPEDRERIFERFVRLDASRAHDGFGTGLGLAIARGLAEAHGGSLECAPASRGARFVLRLPSGSLPAEGRCST